MDAIKREIFIKCCTNGNLLGVQRHLREGFELGERDASGRSVLDEVVDRIRFSAAVDDYHFGYDYRDFVDSAILMETLFRQARAEGILTQALLDRAAMRSVVALKHNLLRVALKEGAAVGKAWVGVTAVLLKAYDESYPSCYNRFIDVVNEITAAGGRISDEVETSKGRYKAVTLLAAGAGENRECAFNLICNLGYADELAAHINTAEGFKDVLAWLCSLSPSSGHRMRSRSDNAWLLRLQDMVETGKLDLAARLEECSRYLPALFRDLYERFGVDEGYYTFLCNFIETLEKAGFTFNGSTREEMQRIADAVNVEARTKLGREMRKVGNDFLSSIGVSPAGK